MPETSRRGVLAAASAALAGAAAGCVSPSDASPSTDLSVRAVAAEEYRHVPTGPDAVPDGVDFTPFAGFGIGEERTDDGDDPPHCVWVWNGADRERALTVEVATDTDTVFERSLAFALDACAGFVLFTPAAYTSRLAAGLGDTRQPSRSRGSTATRPRPTPS